MARFIKQTWLSLDGFHIDRLVESLMETYTRSPSSSTDSSPSSSSDSSPPTSAGQVGGGGTRGRCAAAPASGSDGAPRGRSPTRRPRARSAARPAVVGAFGPPRPSSVGRHEAPLDPSPEPDDVVDHDPKVPRRAPLAAPPRKRPRRASPSPSPPPSSSSASSSPPPPPPPPRRQGRPPPPPRPTVIGPDPAKYGCSGTGRFVTFSRRLGSFFVPHVRAQAVRKIQCAVKRMTWLTNEVKLLIPHYLALCLDDPAVTLTQQIIARPATWRARHPPRPVPQLDLSHRFFSFDLEGLSDVLGAEVINSNGQTLARRINGVPVAPKGSSDLERARSDLAYWTALLDLYDGFLDPRILRRDGPGGSLINQFQGRISTDGHVVRVYLYKGGIRPRADTVGDGGDEEEDEEGAGGNTVKKAAGKKKAGTKTTTTATTGGRQGRRFTGKFHKPFAGVSVDGAGSLTLDQVLAEADKLAPHGSVQVPIPGGRDKVESHKKKIVVRYGQCMFVIDAGVRDFLTGFVVPFELARLFRRLQYLAYLAAQGGDGPWSEVIKAYIRSAVSRVVLTRPLFRSLSSREFHHHVGTDQAREQRKASRAKAGLVPGDAAHSCVAGDHRAVARVATEYMEAKVEESCSHGVCSTKFTNEGRRKAYWADLARALRGHVVLIGRNCSGFGMISAANKGPVVEMVTVYAVDENYSSKWCAACAMAEPAAAKADKTNLLGKTNKKVYQTRACRRCGVRVQRDRNAAVNILSFAIKQLVFEDQAKDADGNPLPAARPKHRYHRKRRTTPTVE
ncbi:hypothetical protein H9P43_000824 [Blastocladiella emersonii ATCC 22665]|nr:hypothetical protein H9P43_000824 [Blastocladiella emersonii ATCC 22665]